MEYGLKHLLLKAWENEWQQCKIIWRMAHEIIIVCSTML